MVVVCSVLFTIVFCNPWFASVDGTLSGKLLNNWGLNSNSADFWGACAELAWIAFTGVIVSLIKSFGWGTSRSNNKTLFWSKTATIESIDDSCAREKWDWKPSYDLASMTKDMLDFLRRKLNN